MLLRLHLADTCRQRNTSRGSFIECPFPGAAVSGPLRLFVSRRWARPPVSGDLACVVRTRRSRQGNRNMMAFPARTPFLPFGTLVVDRFATVEGAGVGIDLEESVLSLVAIERDELGVYVWDPNQQIFQCCESEQCGVTFAVAMRPKDRLVSTEVDGGHRWVLTLTPDGEVITELVGWEEFLEHFPPVGVDFDLVLDGAP